MEKIFNDIIVEVEKINNFLKSKALSKKEIAEENENFKDFIVTKKKLKQLLNKIKKTPVNNFKENSKNLLNLHVLMCDLTWYVDNLHEYIQKVIKHYPYEE